MMNPSNEDLRLLVKVSRFYYEDGLNQDAIKDRLGLSRSKVSRLMAQAREQGVVQISVVSPAAALPGPGEPARGALRPAGGAGRGVAAG